MNFRMRCGRSALEIGGILCILSLPVPDLFAFIFSAWVCKIPNLRQLDAQILLTLYRPFYFVGFLIVRDVFCSDLIQMNALISGVRRGNHSRVGCTGIECTWRGVSEVGRRGSAAFCAFTALIGSWSHSGRQVFRPHLSSALDSMKLVEVDLLVFACVV